MNISKISSVASALLASFAISASAQSYVHEQSKDYIWPTDPQVVAKLQDWQDLKFGVLLHWGLYSVPGMVESWAITSEDWITPPVDKTYEEYKQWYWGLIDQFNPVKFNPEQWARVAKDAGMKYVIFTTKHHDGFCLWDTKTTDFNVTNIGFKGNPRQDALRYVLDAFRNEGLMPGTYFSKPDWHSDYYWWTKKATPNRSHNYKIEQYPERWDNYKKFVFDQVEELMTNYGDVDILWLDGGWCTAPREDINLDGIVEMARKKQPGLIVVERACPGIHENYQTPEQTIPDHQILNPWESCITLTYDWGWTPRNTWKSPAKVISILSEIVAKGGSLVLGVGPTPEGEIEPKSVEELKIIGNWLRANGEAIYSTVPTPVYRNDDSTIWFTANKDGKTIYGIVPQKDDADFPATISWKGNVPVKGSKIVQLSTGKKLKYKTEGDVTTVTLPRDANGSNGVAFKIITKK